MTKINIIESDRDIQKKINAALAKEVNKSLAFTSRVLKSRIEPIIRSALLSSPEISSLKGGILKAEFGLTSDPTGAIINAIISSLKVDFVKVDKTFSGGIVIVMQLIISPIFFLCRVLSSRLMTTVAFLVAVVANFGRCSYYH